MASETEPDSSADPAPLPLREIQRRAASGSLWTAIHAVTSLPLGFAANAVVARLLGPGSFGQLAYLTLTLAILTQVTNLSVNDAVIQWGAAAEARGERLEADQYLKKSLGYRLMFQLPLLVAAVLYLSWSESVVVRLILLVSVIFPTVFGSSALSITIENRTAAAARLVMATNFLMQVAGVVTAVVVRSAPSVWAARSLALSLLIPTNLLLLDRHRRRVALTVQLPKELPSGFWRYARYTVLASVLGTLVFSRSELYYLRWWGHNPASVGIYALAFAVAGQITGPVDALLGPLIPAVAGVLSSAPHAASRALRRALRFGSLASGGILALGIAPLYFLLPRVFGVHFASAQNILLPLAAVSCLQTCFNPIVAFVLGRRRGDIMLSANATGLAVGFVIAVLTIPHIGLWGAVSANVAGQVVVFAWLGIFEARAQGGDRWALAWAEIGAWLAGVGALSAGIAVGKLASNDFASAAISFAVGGAAYIVLVRAFNAALDASEWRIMADLLPDRAGPALLRLSRVFG